MSQEPNPGEKETPSVDREAFRQLVEENSRSVFRIAFRVLGDEASADDVVQETFLRAYRKLSTFDGRSRMSTWLHRIAINQAIDLRRKQQRQVDDMVLEAEVERPAAASSTTPQPDRLLAAKQVGEATRDSLDRLSVLERSAFLLRHVEGCSIAEIGLALDLGPSATKQAIFRAVKKLRQALEPWMRTQHEAAS